MRPTRDHNMMDVASVIAERSECPRRKVGAVIASKEGRILATGFNGLAPGQTPCTISNCGGESYSSGKGLDVCLASHAEISALISLGNHMEAHTLYVTTAPCITCTKALLLTNIKRIVFRESYRPSGFALWDNSTRVWEKLK